MNHPELFDICASRHRGQATSVAANKQVDKLNDRKLVYAAISERRNGLTVDELAAIIDCGPNQISGRFTELAAQGLIYKTDERRKTRSGATAFVWRIKQ